MTADPSNTSHPHESLGEMTALRSALEAQEHEITRLRARLADLERAGHVEVPEQRATRRRVLALAGGAAVAAVGTTAAIVRPAAAANGNAVNIAATAQITAGTGLPTWLDYSPVATGAVNYLLVSNVTTDPAPTRVQTFDLRAAIAGEVGLTSRTRTGVIGISQAASGTGVVGVATGGTGAYGVWGDSASGIGAYGSSYNGTGVWGQSDSGYAVYAGGNGRIGMASFLAAGPPTAGTFALHDLIGDQQGDIWACIAAGTPGTWRKITAEPVTIPPTPPATQAAVSFHPLAPARVYDSRVENAGAGPLIAPISRNISVADARDLRTGAVTVPNYVPAGTVAITCNVTVVNTQGVGGFLTLNPGGTTTVSAATINWFGPNQILNNGVTLAVDANRLLTAVVGPNQATDFIVDVTGYFL